MDVPVLSRALVGISGRVPLTIDPKTPAKDLLPKAPKAKKPAILVDDLSKVPEIEFQALPAKPLPVHQAATETAYTIARIKHLNKNKTDGFLETFLAERKDLNGLPFAMGDACPTKGERTRQFSLAVATVRRAMPASPQLHPTPQVQSSQMGRPAENTDSSSSSTASVVHAVSDGFWERYHNLCSLEDKQQSKLDRAKCDHITVARIAALMQILAPESPEVRLGLVKDFSMLQAVADAAPWPEMQRFDFLVRKRELTEEEAVEFKEKLESRKLGALSPYHRAALAALRELTGKDAEPTAKVWRALLETR